MLQLSLCFNLHIACDFPCAYFCSFSHCKPYVELSGMMARGWGKRMAAIRLRCDLLIVSSCDVRYASNTVDRIILNSALKNSLPKCDRRSRECIIYGDAMTKQATKPCRWHKYAFTLCICIEGIPLLLIAALVKCWMRMPLHLPNTKPSDALHNRSIA